MSTPTEGAETPPVKRASYIYSRIVDAEDDLIGMIAYSLYKRGKISFINSYREETGRDPTDEDLRAFHRAANLPDRISAYREEATALLTEFSEAVLDDELDDVRAAYHEELSRRLQKAQPFWRGVWQSVIASVVVLVIVAAAFTVIWSYRIGMVDAVEQIFDVEIERRGAL